MKNKKVVNFENKKVVKLKRELKSDKIINIKFMYGKNNLYEKNKVITNYLPRKEKMLKIILNEKKKVVQNYFMRKEKFDTKIQKNLQKFFFLLYNIII